MGMPLDLLWLAVPGYIILQIFVLMRTSGSARVGAGAPLFLMVPVYMFTLFGIVNASNLWPLALLFASPVALLYVAIATFVYRKPGKPAAT